MQPKMKLRRTSSWALPIVLWIASLSMLSAGFLIDTALLGVSFMVLVTAIVSTFIALEAASAAMDVYGTSDRKPAQPTLSGRKEKTRGGTAAAS